VKTTYTESAKRLVRGLGRTVSIIVVVLSRDVSFLILSLWNVRKLFCSSWPPELINSVQHCNNCGLETVSSKFGDLALSMKMTLGGHCCDIRHTGNTGACCCLDHCSRTQNQCRAMHRRLAAVRPWKHGNTLQYQYITVVWSGHEHMHFDC
jgi:hypothetical protein